MQKNSLDGLVFHSSIYRSSLNLQKKQIVWSAKEKIGLCEIALLKNDIFTTSVANFLKLLQKLNVILEFRITSYNLISLKVGQNSRKTRLFHVF